MSSTKFFRFPWATSGDKATIPNAVQPSGAVSYSQGFGPDYERNPATDPLAKRVPRDESNQLYYDITDNLRAWQVAGLPEWVTSAQNDGSPVSYPINALVRHDQSGAFRNYLSLVAANTAEPGTDDTKWELQDGFNLSLLESAAGRLIGIKIFTSSGTYTPPPGMTFCIVEGCGGGGGGAGGSNPSAGNVSLGAPGGGATSGRASFTAAQIGASQSVTIGAGGPGALSTSGSAGGTTALGSLLSLPGGEPGGILNNAAAPAFNGNGSISGAAAGANISQKRGSTPGYATSVTPLADGIFCGPSGDTPFGTGRANASNANGVAGIGYGSGGSGVALAAGGGPAFGGDGAPGILIILEYGA